MRPSLLISILTMTVLTSCNLVDVKRIGEMEETEARVPVANAYDRTLYLDDVSSLAPKGSSFADSANFIQRYVDNWVRKQVLVHKASEIMDSEIAEIERKVQEYRYALISYEFEKDYVESHMDTAVSQAQIAAYYDENARNFELKSNIIRGIFIEVPLEAPKLEQVRKWLEEEDRDEEAKKELRSYVSRFASNYYLEDSAWVNFNEIVRNSPFINIPDQINFLKRNKLVENRDENFVYYLKIKEFKLSNENAPVSLISNQIRAIIINKRKLELIRQLEEEMYEEAKAEGDFEILLEKN